MANEIAGGHEVPADEWPKVVADAEKYRLEAEAEEAKK